MCKRKREKKRIIHFKKGSIFFYNYLQKLKIKSRCFIFPLAVSQHVCHFIQIPQPSVWPRCDISPHLVSLSSFVFDASEIWARLRREGAIKPSAWCDVGEGKLEGAAIDYLTCNCRKQVCGREGRGCKTNKQKKIQLDTAFSLLWRRGRCHSYSTSRTSGNAALIWYHCFSASLLWEK